MNLSNVLSIATLASSLILVGCGGEPLKNLENGGSSSIGGTKSSSNGASNSSSTGGTGGSNSSGSGSSSSIDKGYSTANGDLQISYPEYVYDPSLLSLIDDGWVPAKNKEIWKLSLYNIQNQGLDAIGGIHHALPYTDTDVVYFPKHFLDKKLLVSAYHYNEDKQCWGYSTSSQINGILNIENSDGTVGTPLLFSYPWDNQLGAYGMKVDTSPSPISFIVTYDKSGISKPSILSIGESIAMNEGEYVYDPVTKMGLLYSVSGTITLESIQNKWCYQ